MNIVPREPLGHFDPNEPPPEFVELVQLWAERDSSGNITIGLQPGSDAVVEQWMKRHEHTTDLDFDWLPFENMNPKFHGIR